MADRVGQQFGNYRLLRMLGKGGFAEVYLAEHVEQGTQVALKILPAVLTPKDIERFRAEAQIIASLSHPHIVRLLDYATEQGTPYLVMEYAPHGSLRERHPRGVALPEEQVLSYIRQVADALQYAHDQKLIHRDVKPENLLLGPDDQVLLTDFGIAMVAKSSHSQSIQEVIGSVSYIAPEQTQGKPRPASDQYALGVVAYEWLTGEPPFEGSMIEIATQHLLAPPTPLRQKVPTISEAVEQVVLRALAKDPHRRFLNVSTFALALEQASSGASPLLFESTQVMPPVPVDASMTLDPALAGLPALAASNPAVQQAITAKTAPQLPQTFSMIPGSPPTPPVQPPGSSVRQPGPHARRRLLSSVVIGFLALLLIVGAGAAFALNRPNQPGESGSALTGTNSATSSVGGSTATATFPNGGGSGTPGSNGASGGSNGHTPGATNPPGSTPTPTLTPTIIPGPHPTITSDCGNLVTPWVAIYQYSNYGGRELCFEGYGLVNLGAYNFNKETESINIAASGDFYDQPNGQGNRLAFYVDDEQSDLGSWDNRISSFIVTGMNGSPPKPTPTPTAKPTATPTSPAPHPTVTSDCGNLVTPWVAIYQYSNYGGRELCFEGTGLINLADYGFDAETMSINIAANGDFFDQPNGQGNELAFYYGDEQSDLGSWDNRISSFIVYS